MRRLLIRPGAIGDFVVSLPTLEHLRASYTEIWTASANVPLASFADQAYSIASRGLDRLGVLPAEDVVERLRSFHSIVSWYGTNRPEFRDFVGQLNLPFEFLNALPNGPEHAVDFYLKQVGAPLGQAPRVICPPVLRRPGAVLHPFASRRDKRWPFHNFQELARCLPGDLPVRWLAGPEEHLEGAMRISDLYELACWLSTAAVFIGNDSGIGHLAAAVGTPVISLFGPTDPAVWAPRGPCVQVLRWASERSLNPAEVAQSTRNLLRYS